MMETDRGGGVNDYIGPYGEGGCGWSAQYIEGTTDYGWTAQCEEVPADA